MIDLTPTTEEVQELEPTPEQLARMEYEELIRDKRSVDELPCYEWRDDKCHCHMVAGSKHLEPIHTSKDGKVWCSAHQSTNCDVAHPIITLQQYIERALKWKQTNEPQ